MRPRKANRHLPPRVYEKHGAYYYVHQSKWTKLGYTLPEALMRYGEIIGEADTSGIGMPELIDRALAEHIKIRNLAGSTVTQYRQAARICKEALAGFKPDQVRPRHVAAIKTQLSATPTMANRVISFLRTVFKYAVEWQEVESNPVSDILLYKETPRDVYMSDEEFIAVRNASIHQALPHIMDVCYLTGQRISDVLKIKPETDITEAGIYFQQKKTRQRLLIQMDEALEQVLDEVFAIFPPKPDHSLFYQNSPRSRSKTSPSGGKTYTYTSIKQAWNDAREAAGLPHLQIHDMRAKAITDADATGIDATKLAGHTNKRMTDRYLRLRRTISSPASGTLPKAKKQHQKA